MSADLYYVKLADGDVHRVSLDQLDDAFQAGHIDGATMVLADGSDTWTTLGALAGIDDEDNGDAVAPVQVIPQSEPRTSATAPAPYSHSQSYVPQQSYIPQQPSYVPQQASRPAAAPAAQPWQASQPWQAPVPSAMPRAPQASPYSQAPRTPYGQTVSMAPRPMMPNSVRPVSVDLGDDDADFKPARRGGGKRVAGVFALLAVVGAAAGIATVRPPFARPLLHKIGLNGPSAPVVAVAAPPPPAPAELPPRAQEPTPPPAPPQPAAAASSGAPGSDSPLSPRFTDRTSPQPKDEPAKPDPKHVSKGRLHVSQPASHGSAKAKSNGVFTTGGNKYDPLNSSI